MDLTSLELSSRISNSGVVVPVAQAKASRLVRPLSDGLHQVLYVWEDVGVGLVPVLGDNLAVDYHVKLAVGSGG